MVLLKNNGLLPLTAGSTIAVVGPMGVNQDLMSDYAGGDSPWGNGEAGCWPKSDSSCAPLFVGGWMLLVCLLSQICILYNPGCGAAGPLGRAAAVVLHGQSPLSAVQVCYHDRRGDRRSERRRHHNGCQGRRCEQARTHTHARARAHATLVSGVAAQQQHGDLR
jgi:hypothetical protein